MNRPLTRFELFCELGRLRREYRLAARMFDPIQPERAESLARDIAELEALMRKTEVAGRYA